ncbi:MAG TPA: hypothetical protein DCY79_01955 [Planctomycetaceae bacterium]|nr:hypothetical protein [Planctomycetaceae bacterium]
MKTTYLGSWSVILFVQSLLMLPAVAVDAQHALEVTLAGESSAARVVVRASDGSFVAPEGLALRKTKRGQAYFYADKAFRVTVPAGKTEVHLSGGLEVIPQSAVINVQQATQLRMRLQRWIDMPSQGWYSGDSHVHLHTGGKYPVNLQDALVAARAEGVNYVNLCVSNNLGDDIRDADLINGQPHPLSTDEHVLFFGEEMRSSIYGHMQFFGIRKLVEPQYTGFDNTPHENDFPANYTLAAEACRQGGLVTYAHPMFADQPLPFGDDPTAPNGAARELPVDAMLGVVQAVDLICYNSDEKRSTDLWYRLLNCGLKLSACVGTDALLDQSTDPLGGGRVYVQTAGKFSHANWLAGLRAGRTFVTNGPLLELTVDETRIGATCQRAAGELDVRARVQSRVPFTQIEVIVNGEVVEERKCAPPAKADSVQTEQFQVAIPIKHSSWVALRVQGPDHPAIFDGPAFAHSSPVYVEIDDKPIARPQDAAYFVDWIDRLLRVVAARDRYASASERQAVERLFRRARDRYQKLAEATP